MPDGPVTRILQPDGPFATVYRGIAGALMGEPWKAADSPGERARPGDRFFRGKREPEVGVFRWVIPQYPVAN